jgi:hypothetical protein
MKSIFWIVTIILCLTISESFVSWMLAVFVGNYNLTDGFDRAFNFFTFKGYLFSLGFRIIPFIALFFVISVLKNSLTKYINAVSWCWLNGMVFFIAFCYWDVQHSLYTDAHTASTSGIAFIFIPFLAIPVGFISGGLGLAGALVYDKIKSAHNKR